MSGYADDAMEMMQEYQKAKNREPIKFYKKREPMSEKSVIVEAVETMKLAQDEITALRAELEETNERKLVAEKRVVELTKGDWQAQFIQASEIVKRLIKVLEFYASEETYVYAETKDMGYEARAVSYTHLTLPTIYSV